MKFKEVIITSNAWSDISNLAKTDLKLIKKVLELVESIKVSPFDGIGKPELLKENLKGYWSRRINDEHRLIYQVREDKIYIVQAKGHYLDK